MSKTINEDNLTFTFQDSWNICKFDASNFYRNRVEKLDEIKGVDILATQNSELLMIEVKDFRSHRIENIDKQASGKLLIDVAQKFVHTFAALTGASRWSIDYLQPFYLSLNNKEEKRITCILFLERDDQETKMKRKKLDFPNMKKKLKKYLSAYNVQCCVYNRSTLPNELDWSVE